MSDAHFYYASSLSTGRAVPSIQDARSVKPEGYKKQTATSQPSTSYADPETASIATDQISLEKAGTSGRIHTLSSRPTLTISLAEAHANSKPSTWRRILNKST